ncbi:MAG: acyltransferase [Anaerolineae bacterium]|nr:acyltransferase [Anaerolineae bacterium]
MPSLIAETRKTPWKAVNEINRYLLLPRLRLMFALAGVDWGQGWRLYGAPRIQRHRESVMHFGDHMELRSSPASNPLGVNHRVGLCTWLPGAELIVGDHFGMTGGSIVAAQSVRIGNRVMIGANTVIADTDFHPLDAATRANAPHLGANKPIVIGDDVFIGMQCLILKGTIIGTGSVIGAGSVVSGEIPAGVIAAGNPARVIRSLDEG